LKELAFIFNNNKVVFDNFFEDRLHSGEELRSLDNNDFKERPESFLKGKQPSLDIVLFEWY
jgi:hypothetical protein